MCNMASYLIYFSLIIYQITKAYLTRFSRFCKSISKLLPVVQKKNFHLKASFEYLSKTQRCLYAIAMTRYVTLYKKVTSTFKHYYETKLVCAIKLFYDTKRYLCRRINDNRMHHKCFNFFTIKCSLQSYYNQYVVASSKHSFT